MKNNLIEEYIKDNNLDIFEKEYIDDFLVQLKDHNSTMHLLQIFNYILVNIDSVPFNTFTKCRVLDGSYQWCVVPNFKYEKRCEFAKK